MAAKLMEAGVISWGISGISALPEARADTM